MQRAWIVQVFWIWGIHILAKMMNGGDLYDFEMFYTNLNKNK